MAKSKRDKFIDDITVLVMCILSVPVFGYVGVVMVIALFPTLKMVWALIAYFGIMIGTLFDILAELAPFLVVFAIVIGLMLVQGYGGNDRN